MIDDPEKTGRLLAELEASLPVPARLSQPLIRLLSKQFPDLEVPATCNVVSIFYLGDEGGIVCGLDIAGPESKEAHYVSITHLGFDRRTPLYRPIDAYQRHRIKKLKQEDRRRFSAFMP